jgi:hypothetical protein
MSMPPGSSTLDGRLGALQGNLAAGQLDGCMFGSVEVPTGGSIPVPGVASGFVNDGSA